MNKYKNPRIGVRGFFVFTRLTGILTLLVLAAGCATFGGERIIQPAPPLTPESKIFFTPQTDDDPPLWGVRGGIVIGIHPAAAGFATLAKGGPRGLIRVGYENNGRVYFINFFALSPVTTDGLRGMSELEDSPTDNHPGIRIEAYPPDFHENRARWNDRRPPPLPETARRDSSPTDGQRLSLVFRYEAFENGALVYLLVTLREKRPREVEFQFFSEPNGPPLKMCVLSSTFGNITRLRELVLADRVLNARQMWPHYQGNGFAQPFLFPLGDLARNGGGDVIFAANPDEPRPWEGRAYYPHPRSLRQYFRIPRDEIRPGLRGLVNGRYVFWKTTNPVPGGIAFENMAMVEPFRVGARLIFGYAAADSRELFD